MLSIKSLLVLFSYHHNNTEKIANVFAKVLDAQIKTPWQINPEELQEYSLLSWLLEYLQYKERNRSIELRFQSHWNAFQRKIDRDRSKTDAKTVAPIPQA